MAKPAKNFSTIFWNTFFTVYPPSGWNRTNHTFRKSIIGSSIIFRITSFLNLPNHLSNDLSSSEKDIFLQVMKNMSAWNDIASDDPLRSWKLMWNIVKAPFVFLVYITLSLLTTPLNIVKVVTEFLPSLLANLSNEGAKRANNASEKYKIEKTVEAKLNNNLSSKINYYLYRALYQLAKGFSLLCDTILFIGMAITSPAESILSAWRTGHKYFGTEVWIDGEKTYEYTVSGCVAGALLALLSLAITLTVYILLFPLFATLLANTAAGTVIANIAHVFEPASTAIFHFLNPLFTAFSLPLASNVAINGFAALVGMCATLILPTAGICWEHIKDWLDHIDWRKDYIKNENHSSSVEVPKELPRIIRKPGKVIKWLKEVTDSQNPNGFFSSSKPSSENQNNHTFPLEFKKK